MFTMSPGRRAGVDSCSALIRNPAPFIGPSSTKGLHPVLCEHAEHKTVDEVPHCLQIVTPVAQTLRRIREGRRRAFSHPLPCLSGPQPLRVRHRPL